MISMLAEPITSQTQPEKPQSWGVGVLAVAFAVFLGSGILGILAGGLLNYGLVAWLAGPEALPDVPYNRSELPAAAQALASEDGLFLCAFLFMAPFGIALLWFAVPRQVAAPREYLGLKWPGLQQGLLWTLIFLATHYGCWLLVDFLGMSRQDDSFHEIIRVPLLLPLAFVALAVLLPIFTEVLLRGFLLEGLRRSKLGEVGAILIAASILTVGWSDIPPMGEMRLLLDREFLHDGRLFLDAIVLGVARLRTGSTYLAVLLSVIVNAVAVLSIAFG
jgi:membrane protease YdiL (CAAX protease family)